MEEDAALRREDSRREYLKRRVEKKILSLEEDIEYSKIAEDHDTTILESVLNVVKEPENALKDEQDDFEANQLKRMGHRVKKFKSTYSDQTISAGDANLPINEHEDAIIKLIQDNQVCVIVAETGSGKTTQIPQMLYRNGMVAPSGKLVCTQPRRVAAMSVARRVSDELGITTNMKEAIVGYSVRFDDQSSPNTLIRFVTDGMLLREFVNCPDLAGYGTVIIDEAHERTVATDILLGLLKDLCRFRADLRLIISSATLNATKFSQFFNGAPVYKVPGRLFAVERRFLQAPIQDYLGSAVQCCLDICRKKQNESSDYNDILVFLSGQEEIEAACRVLREKAIDFELPIIVYPLYAALPASMQQAIFKPTPHQCTKIVLATNIAETSITVDGIVHVIDSGMVKQKAFNPRTGVDSLQVTATSRASAEQRAGRAGRTRPGICYRLYTSDTFATEMLAEGIPEMQRSNLSSILLFMKALGIDDVVSFDFVDPPPPDLLARSITDLYRLGALEAQNGELTKVGLLMSEFPVDPPLARVIIESIEVKCVEAVVKIVALISLEMTLIHHHQAHAENNDKKGEKRKEKTKPFASPYGDHFMLLGLFNNWIKHGKNDKWCAGLSINPLAIQQADNIRRQLMGIVQRLFPEYDFDTPQSEDYEHIQKAFMSGFANNVATVDRTGLSYTMAGGRTAFLHPSSCLADQKPPKKILFHDILCTSKDFIRTAMIIE